MKAGLARHLEGVRQQHHLDVERGAGWVELPDALKRKYPNAGREWAWQPDWVVYAKRPFAGPEQVLEYLGRYTHRVALWNDRILSLAAGLVRFRWKDYADGDRVKVMALEAAEFLRRFLLHVVPDGFVRIRHFGLLANRTRQAKLARCRQLLAQPPAPADRPTESVHALMLRLTGLDIERCALCHRGRLRVIEIFPPLPRPARAVSIWDTS